MKNESIKDTVKFIANTILNLCTIKAASLSGIITELSCYFGGIGKFIIVFMIYVLVCHNILIPFYKYKFKNMNWNDVKPSIVFTLICLIISAGVLCCRYIVPKIASAGFIEELYEKFVTENPDVSNVPTDKDDFGATQEPPIDIDSSPIIHIVQKGENLYRLAKKYGTTVDKILADNIGKYPKMTRRYIVTGWELIIER